MRTILDIIILMTGIFVSGISLMISWNICNLSHNTKFVEFMLFQGISSVLVSICSFIETIIIKN